LLALLALTLTWGAWLDPAESVAGLHGTLTGRTLDVRLAAAPVVAGVGIAATVVTLVWGLRERPMLLVVAWSALLVASLLGFAVIPASLSSAGPDERAATDRDTALARERRRLEGLAFGLTALTDSAPPGFPDLDAATTAVPIWDAERVLAKAATRRDLVRSPGTPAAAGLSPHSFGAGRSTWIVALRPDRDSAALQQPPPGWAALARRETDGLVLLWRRDVPERLGRLAPFASFADAVPVVADSALWWVAYGYFEGDGFPLARPVVVAAGDSLRYLRAGLLGTVNAANGDTRLYLAPGADSLAAAWAKLLAPLIRPLDSLPRALRAQLPFPVPAFRAATAP